MGIKKSLGIVSRVTAVPAALVLLLSILWLAGRIATIVLHTGNFADSSVTANIVIGSIALSLIGFTLILMINGSHLIGSSLAKFASSFKVDQGGQVSKPALSYHMQLITGLPFFLIGANGMCMVAYMTGQSVTVISSAMFL